MRTISPTLQAFSGSCARYFLDFRIVFLRTGCVKRRSTETVTVWSFLSLVTVPERIRFGIDYASDVWLADVRSDAAAAAFSFRMVFTRAVSRLTARMRAVFSS